MSMRGSRPVLQLAKTTPEDDFLHRQWEARLRYGHHRVGFDRFDKAASPVLKGSSRLVVLPAHSRSLDHRIDTHDATQETKARITLPLAGTIVDGRRGGTTATGRRESITYLHQYKRITIQPVLRSTYVREIQQLVDDYRSNKLRGAALCAQLDAVHARFGDHYVMEAAVGVAFRMDKTAANSSDFEELHAAVKVGGVAVLGGSTADGTSGGGGIGEIEVSGAQKLARSAASEVGATEYVGGPMKGSFSEWLAALDPNKWDEMAVWVVKVGSVVSLLPDVLRKSLEQCLDEVHRAVPVMRVSKSTVGRLESAASQLSAQGSQIELSIGFCGNIGSGKSSLIRSLGGLLSNTWDVPVNHTHDATHSASTSTTQQRPFTVRISIPHVSAAVPHLSVNLTLYDMPGYPRNQSVAVKSQLSKDVATGKRSTNADLGVASQWGYRLSWWTTPGRAVDYMFFVLAPPTMFLRAAAKRAPRQPLKEAGNVAVVAAGEEDGSAAFGDRATRGEFDAKWSEWYNGGGGGGGDGDTFDYAAFRSVTETQYAKLGKGYHFVMTHGDAVHHRLLPWLRAKCKDVAITLTSSDTQWPDERKVPSGDLESLLHRAIEYFVAKTTS